MLWSLSPQIRFPRRHQVCLFAMQHLKAEFGRVGQFTRSDTETRPLENQIIIISPQQVVTELTQNHSKDEIFRPTKHAACV